MKRHKEHEVNKKAKTAAERKQAFPEAPHGVGCEGYVLGSGL